MQKALFVTHVRETRHSCVDFIPEVEYEKNVKEVKVKENQQKSKP